MLRTTKDKNFLALSFEERDIALTRYILSMRKGSYLFDNSNPDFRSISLFHLVFDKLGPLAAIHLSRKLLLGLSTLFPEKIYYKKTLGLDEIIIKSSKKVKP